ncbi:AfsR/SARP family transcriptional regulator [Actinoplanes teichomyceticus]|uniref:DNA-binding SARP family transcriptional activator n=1 Tax=Actinoplanes teichomyceticus TaxID=1867 RepID=A0A561VII0_ACTTI|nr:AfsR/SARP family transcriptional regulator [Actinoplanes teichomyceticus]TWG11419.1 DNA-binding SARP family transcriptional activator [Actinoplanes teichomyceticus]
MEILVLGPLTVRHGGRDVVVRAAKARAVLAYLVVHCGQLVSFDALGAEVWPDGPPVSATNTLQTYVSQLRRLLEPERGPGDKPRVLRSVPGGYVLDLPPDQLDSRRFEEAVRRGRAALEAAEYDKAADLLHAALGWWRGAAYGNAPGDSARREAARLEQCRLVATELRIDADLALGRHAEVVGELEGLVLTNPWREEPVAQLMLALYRSGRQADALGVYRAARARLVAELGVEPGPKLHRLEQRILRQDPDLGIDDARRALPPPPVARSRARPTAPSRAARRPGRGRIAAVAVLAVMVVAGLGARDRGTPHAPPADGIFAEFDVAVRPGIGYDLDIPAGQPSDWHATNDPRSPDYHHLDLYRTSPDAPHDQISGVDLTETNAFNAVHAVNPGDPPQVCRGLSRKGGGNVRLAGLAPGAEMCLRTHAGRWALLTVIRMPERRQSVLPLHVTVLND